MSETQGIFVGTGEEKHYLLHSLANRHGLIAGATGTGKTVTLQILAEGFAKAGVPVFMADVKGDLSGISQSGSPENKLHPKLLSRAEKIGLDDYGYRNFHTVFWDLYGEQGHPIRTTIADMGAQLLANLMELNDTQEGVLNIAFVVAEEMKMPLIDLKDLRAILVYVSDNAKDIQTRYGNVSSASVGAIQRRLLVLEQQGAEHFFGEPALQLSDMMQKRGKEGYINILAADKLINSPKLYSTFLLWMLTKLFEELPEVGNPDKPKLVFFFDEAHLLFDDAPKALLEKVEQVVRLIRSKGVGVFFVTQNPMDVPDDVLGQLGNRVQHALRAFTPRDQKAVKVAAQTFRQNPKFKAEDAITELGVGEALVSMLDEKAAPSIVERALIRPPESRLGPASPDERIAVIADSPVVGVYETLRDRESAYEQLEDVRAEKAEEKAKADAKKAEEEKEEAKEKESKKSTRSSGRMSTGESVMRSVLRSIGTKLAGRIVNAILRMIK